MSEGRCVICKLGQLSPGRAKHALDAGDEVGDLEQLTSPLPEHGQRFRDLFGVFPDRIPAKLG